MLFPQDKRLAQGGAGVYLGKNHPCNLAEQVHGRGMTSYRAELYAVAATLFRSQHWEKPLWITLDNQAVVHDVKKALTKMRKMPS